jgi:hypothetical protein
MNAWDLFVFRKAREQLSTQTLLEDLRNTTDAADALVRAGELETGLADADSDATAAMAAIVDSHAEALCQAGPGQSAMLKMALPETILCGHTEGFSFYGLHPLDFADLADAIHTKLPPAVAIIGIRSAGAVLSAVVKAVLQSHGKKADRITVRPRGEPYQRIASFTAAQLAWIQQRRNADFLIVDEGPGFSGSTFLSVAAALSSAGVPHTQIALMGSRPFDSIQRNAQWRTFNIAYGRRGPADAKTCIGNGYWRQHLYPELSHWPACWTEMERAKHLSADGECFLKFEGFGRYGERARQQATILAEEKFSPRCNEFDSGYARYDFVKARPLRPEDASPALLAHIARYCAFRAQSLPAPAATVDTRSLSNMLQRNLALCNNGAIPESYWNGQSATKADATSIPVERPVYADCCMRPHEWLQTPAGQILKTDAVGHAEGHLLPGPVDIAWDLAGAILEWRLNPAQTDFFLNEYRRQSHDNARNRLDQYLLLYAVFRMAFTSMGATSMAAWRESKYLRRDSDWYASQTNKFLQPAAA